MRDYDGIALDHLDRLTDSTGLIQHAIYGIPRRHSGYTTDDNARALRMCARLWRRHDDDGLLRRVTSYLSFVEFARCPSGGFHNFMSYQRHWLDAEGTGDCQGQALRALAEVLGGNLPADHRTLARELIEAALPMLADLRSVRAQAYVILGWGHLWASGVSDIERLEDVAWSAAHRLVEAYQRSLRPDWRWFECRMTYANAVLPHALFVAAQRWPNESFREVAQASFAFLDQATTVDNLFSPIGNNGWYSHGEEKALFDQQPVEAATMGEAAIAAYELLGEDAYLAAFRRAHAWFHGANSLRQPLVDPGRGACYDGLHDAGLNRNQGAESTLAYLWTEAQYLELQRAHGADRKENVARA